MQQEVLNGAAIRISINGRVVGFATGVSFTRNQGMDAIYEVDNPFPAEIRPTRYSVVGSLTGIRTRGSEGLDGAGIINTASINSFFSQSYCVLEIVDRATSIVLYKIHNVMFDNDSWSINARSLVTFNARFTGQFMSTELTDRS